MLKNFIKKLENFQSFTDEETDALKRYMTPVHYLKKNEDIILEEQKPHGINILLEGWGLRYKITRSGKFQTLGFLMPGDACDIHMTLVKQRDHSICAAVPSKFTSIPQDKVEEMYRDHPRMARAFFWSMLVDESTLREWLVNVGSRQADQRMGHLLCELLIRSHASGLAINHSFELPITQQQLGEAMAITPVHTSRVMNRLRQEGLVSFENKFLTIHDWEAMKEFSDFDPVYLHLDRPSPDLAKMLLTT